MNRLLMVAVVALAVAGCAEGIEDRQPGPGPDPVQKPAPAQTFSGDLTEISENERAGIDLGTGAPAAPGLPNEELPMPGQMIPTPGGE